MLWKDLNGYRNWRPTHLPFTLGNTIQDIRSGGLQDEDIALEAWEMAFGLNLCWPSLLKACWNASPANGACSTESTRHNFLVYPHVAFSSRLYCVCGSRWTFVYLIRFVLLFFLFFFFVWSTVESTRNLLSVFVLLHILLPKWKPQINGGGAKAIDWQFLCLTYRHNIRWLCGCTFHFCFHLPQVSVPFGRRYKV